MRIAITTPSGHVGKPLSAMLVRVGVRPLLLARNPEHVDAEVAAEADVAAVDQRDAVAVTAATAGVDALYWVDPPTEGDDPLGDYARATEALVTAVRTNTIGRVVFQSSVGAELRKGAGEIDGLAATEQALDETGCAVTHLRCGFFFTNLLMQLEAVRGGEIPIVLPLDAPLAWVAPQDIAGIALGRLLNTSWTGRHVQAVHGPADLTWPQAMQIVSQAIGRTVAARRIDDDSMRALLSSAGMPDGLVEAVVGMSTGLRHGFVPEQARTVHTTTDTTLGAWAYDVLRPLI